ncbi:MAG: hypothetical protein HWN65_02775 [Candidatus Helarchaeota archaeon]|nr:hypothetical protein [Candidatus Helarchaeota archaeon]
MEIERQKTKKAEVYQPLDKIFPRLLKLIEELLSLERILSPYWESETYPGEHGYVPPWVEMEYQPKDHEHTRVQNEIIDLVKRLKNEFEDADLTVPRNVERHCLYKFVLEYYSEWAPLQEAAGRPVEHLYDYYPYHEIKMNFNAIISKFIAQMKAFQDSIAISEGIELVSTLLNYRTDEDLFRDFRLNLAEMAASIGARKNAYNLVFLAFNREGECEENHEYMEMWQIFFERSAFAKELQAITQSNYDRGNPRIYFLTEYPNLRILYQNDPFKFYKRWNDKDKLQAIFDVIQLISFPFNEHDKGLFGQFRQLIKPVCEVCLELEGLDKYFDLVEIFIENGKEKVGFELYQLLCQELKNELLECPIAPYRESVKGAYRQPVDWDRFEYLHSRLDKALFQLLKGIPIDPEGALFADIVKFFLERPSDFEYDFGLGYISLFKAIIANNPEKIKLFLSHLKDWNSLTIRLIFAIPLKMMENRFDDIFERVINKLDDLDWEWLSETHPFFYALIKWDRHPNIYIKIIKLEHVLELLYSKWRAGSEFESNLTSLQKLLMQIDDAGKTAVFELSIQALQQWRDKMTPNKFEGIEKRQFFQEFNDILSEIHQIYFKEFTTSRSDFTADPP